MKNPKELLQTMLSKVGCGFSPASVEVLKELVTIQLDEPGTLSKRIGDDKRLAISRMKVIGALDSSDVKCLRNMPQLEELDLSESKIVTGGCYYIEAWYCQNEEDVMGLYMFHRNAKLKSIIFPKGVLAIRPMAFRRCSALSEVVFSPALERIDDRAFSYCDSLEQLRFPASLKKMGTDVFKGCRQLTAIHMGSEVPPFAKSDTFEGMNTDACTLFVPKGAKDNYWLADGWEKFRNIVEE